MSTTAYYLTATVVDRNGVTIGSTNAQTLGEYHRVRYLTREAAESAREAAEELAQEHYATAKIAVESEEVDELTSGEKYDVQSVRDAGFTIDDAGYQMGDFFDHLGRYLGPDENGIEPSPNDGW